MKRKKHSSGQASATTTTNAVLFFFFFFFFVHRSLLSDRYRLIEQYAQNTHDSARTEYDLVLEEVFDLEREGESERFIRSGSSKLSRRLLWHGSRWTNFAGMLSRQPSQDAQDEVPLSQRLARWRADIMFAQVSQTLPHSLAEWDEQ
ncbi:MAG: hypothetical protein J3Q66DRAFT_330105 [Benniella sp.]|nr:MAG: hypothetical protein J3Q66DRAFT_330105 [Benniella sp.]